MELLVNRKDWQAPTLARPPRLYQVSGTNPLQPSMYKHAIKYRDLKPNQL